MERVKWFVAIFSLSLLLIAAKTNALESEAAKLENDEQEYFDSMPVMPVKRSFINFGLMIWKVLKKNPLDYNGYGCWCGKGGKGKPVDGVDRCCRAHDKCYDRAPCKKAKLYITNYFAVGTKCIRVGTNKCGRALCACDSRAVKCYKRNKFNKKYKKWPQKKCRKPRKPRKKRPSVGC